MINDKEIREIRAVLLPATEANIQACGERIRQGKLVSFPTETVYGLGADATNEAAVRSIFAAKERPLTDPVIVHIADLEMVDRIVSGEREKMFIKEVGKVLWPGPLTMIGPINPQYIPPVVGSYTGTVGVRMPSNEVARQLIRAADRPIAAPSANKFMHVSPTRGSHVFADLKYEDVTILDGEMSDLGVESTVVKVDALADKFRITLLRTGTFDFEKLQEKIKDIPQFKDTEFLVGKKRVTHSEEDVACAPGQLLKHYSPYVQTFLLSQIKASDTEGLIRQEADLTSMGVIDFKMRNEVLKNKVRYYVDLDEEGDFTRAMQRLYDELRKAEDPKLGLKNLMLVNLSEMLSDRELILNTLADKTYRSAAGVEVFYDPLLNFYATN